MTLNNKMIEVWSRPVSSLVKVSMNLLSLLEVNHLVSMQSHRKIKFFYPLIRTRMFACQEVRNISFSEDYA